MVSNPIPNLVAQSNSKANEIHVEITREEITVSKQDKLAWSKSYSWSDVEEIDIKTSDENLFVDEDSPSGIPLSVTSGRIRLGKRDEPHDSSIDDFSGSEEARATDGAEAGNGSNPDEESDNGGAFWANVEKETGIKFDPETDEVIFPEKYSASEGFRRFVRYLFNSGYITRDDLPWSTPKSTKNYVLSQEPVNKNGEDLSGAAEALPGVYFDAKTPREYKERYTKMLAKEFVRG